MSRARDYLDPRTGETIWFDVKNLTPTDRQIELLALVEHAELDDLLEGSLTQRGIYDRLHASLREASIPAEVLRRRDEWREQRQTQPPCRKCGKIGDSTKHHFVNKWILRELTNYQQKWACRTKNCIPICIDCHRDIHSRECSDKHIGPYLIDEERQFAQAAIKAFLHERPVIFGLQLEGDPEHSYEACLIRDWCNGAFKASSLEAVDKESIAA